MPKQKKNQNKNKSEYIVGSAIELKDGLKGIIRYIGKVKGANGKNKKGMFYGIELTEAKGKNDGYVNGRSYFMTKPNHGIFVKLDRIKCAVSITENKMNPYPYTATQFFDNLLHIFILYLDDVTLCNLIKIPSFSDTFNIKKLITPQQFMHRLMKGSKNKLSKLNELYKKKIYRWDSFTFIIWNIANYNPNQNGKDKNKTLRRVYCVCLLLSQYANKDTEIYNLKSGEKYGRNREVVINDEYVKFWSDYAQSKMEANKSKKWNGFGYGGDMLKGWDSFDGKFWTKKSLQTIFTSGKVFGKSGKILFSNSDRLLLGGMIELMVKEWIVLNGGISQDNNYDHHSERFSWIFGWISPQCVVMLGAPYKVSSFDYYDD